MQCLWIIITGTRPYMQVPSVTVQWQSRLSLPCLGLDSLARIGARIGA
jgi:hypothetical protein